MSTNGIEKEEEDDDEEEGKGGQVVVGWVGVGATSEATKQAQNPFVGCRH